MGLFLTRSYTDPHKTPPLFEKAHIASPLHTQTLNGRFNSVIDRYGSRRGYSDMPQIPLIRPVLTEPLTHSV
mgnify:CR=1